MKLYLSIVTWSLFGWMTFISFVAVADAERLPKSDLGSTLNQQCDLCWYPSPNEERSSRLPTYKQPRHKHPPDSRPQRYPKGRYKLGGGHKQTRLSTLRSKARQEMRLLSDLQVHAVDGDTIRVGGERIRLRGIDTPEMSEFEGPAAKQRLEELLRAGPIRIVPHARDVYDRLVADVFVNGQNVAEILRNEGFSKAG
ncbi:MAG: thermonuclease family protein [Nitrospira sp.]|jgi:micrococcal nuclease|nr:thermonuclease family protein [Nitrospira sp.]MDH4244137.1 thermonuclease family protein [Nitrospira sp.]MDH4356180.1 thermonuclease family protein [Nitrospira sp.]